MQTAKIVQAVILMLILALAASCAPSNQYISKIFVPRNAGVPKKDSQQVRFLAFDSTSEEPAVEWVKSDTKSEIKTDTVVAEKTSPVIIGTVAKTSNPEAPLPYGQGKRTKKTRD